MQLGAIALPYGPLPGLDAGDGILLQFNEALKAVNVNGKAAVDALMTITPSNWAQNYTGTWINSSVLFIQALQVDNWNQSTFQQSVALPQLVISILPSGGLTSQDGTSSPMSATISGVRLVASLVLLVK